MVSFCVVKRCKSGFNRRWFFGPWCCLPPQPRVLWPLSEAVVKGFRRFIISLCFASAIVFVTGAHASSLRISPVGLDLPLTQRAGAITLINAGSEPLNLQLRAFTWTQQHNADQLSQTSDLIISPPAATIPAGASYTVRVARTELTSTTALSYRLVIDELPKPTDPRTVSQGVAMVLRTSLPVFFSDSRAIADLSWRISRDGDALHVDVINQGQRYAKITGLRLQTHEGKYYEFGQGLNAYVLPDAQKRLSLRNSAFHSLANGAIVRLMGRDGRLDINESVTVHVQP
ncbi:MAG TPA: fimbria/pilus periplasmic chaperone [Paenalcaligenes sp.]|nr:fimbria/pilus periplasmic chaperone [Paenalcaligenes sp.]